MSAVKPNTRWTRKHGEGYATVVEPPPTYPDYRTKDANSAAFSKVVFFVKQRGDEETPDETCFILTEADFLDDYEGGTEAI